MHPKDLKIEDFTYDLPDANIAYHPADPKDSARLLVYRGKGLSETTYRHLADQLPQDAVLVFNDTKVIKSRLLFRKETGGVIEIFCLEPYGEHLNYEQQLNQQGQALWKCLIGKANKWKGRSLQKTIEIDGEAATLTAEIVGKLADSFVIRFSWTPETLTFATVVSHAGVMPLPPYIKRTADANDEETYQTVYSEHEGSVAAPTAGLHFTQRMFADLHKKGIDTLFTTLHVGAGTFMPVKSDTMQDHIMHAEYLSITTEFLRKLLQSIARPIIPVGTTSMRTLESIYWMGNKIMNQPKTTLDDLKTTQWEPYENMAAHEPADAIAALLNWMQTQEMTVLSVETEIIIAPSYRFRIAKGLVTNFHQPQSTLLLLVSALIGDEWRKIYDHALTNGFRFLSYGDGCLLLPARQC